MTWTMSAVGRAQRFEHLARHDRRQQVPRPDVVHRHGAVDLDGPRLVAQLQQQVRDLAPAVEVEGIARQHVLVRGQRRGVLPRPRQGPGLGLQVAELDRHCADVSRSVKCGKVRTLLDAVDALGFDELGRSSEGRPIRGHRFGGTGAPPLLVMGGIHGDEPSSVEAVRRWRSACWRGPAPPGGRARLGAARDQPRRDRARQQELGARRRSEPKLPRPLVHHRPPPGIFPRPGAAVGARDAADRGAIAREGVAAVVAVHAPFACVNYDGPAAAWAEAVAAACGWPAQADIGYPTPGSLGSWLGIDRGLPVLTLELPARELGLHADRAAAALDEAVRAVPVYTA